MEASPANHAIPKRRAIGIVRVSQTKGREGERFVSPEEQRERIEQVCARDGLSLVAVHDELDVSGGKSLAARPGLSAAVAAIEAGQADVVAAAYFDRLFRSLPTQAEVIERVERAGGQVLAVDVGQVTNGSAGQWLSGTMMGAVSEYFRRSAKERSAEGQARAVARGATPWARVPLGYTRRGDGTLEVNPDEVPIVRRAFEMRASGASTTTIRGTLKSHGVERSHRGVQVMLASRVYLGEVHFGKMVNLHAHEPIIERELFARVQRMVVPRGPRPSSDRLLARLGVLRCGSCGARLGSMKLPRQKDYPIYRCPSTSDCKRHVTISAEIAEKVVSDAVRAALADAEGRASAAENARRAISDLEKAQAKLDATVRTLTAAGLMGEPSAVEQLTELREDRDEKQAAVDRIGPEASRTVNAASDWDNLSLAGRRELIRATVESAIVAPSGRGAERITVHLLGQ
ncbi:MAG: recombinase family protein [Solirubrobacterales bacterium]|nr:recombinase family protein [Solirubrobacterales bacterium]